MQCWLRHSVSSAPKKSSAGLGKPQETRILSTGRAWVGAVGLKAPRRLGGALGCIVGESEKPESLAETETPQHAATTLA